MIKTDFKIRYQGSVLGYLWTLLKPLFMFLVLYLVFAVIFKVGKDIPNFPIYLLLGIVLWSFFSEMTSNGVMAVVSSEDLIKKIKISRWLIVVATSASALINLALNLVVVAIFAVVNGMKFTPDALFLLFFISEIYVFSLGISLFLSALYVKYRDISYVWDVVLQAGFYATPILYPIAKVGNVFIEKIMLLNPMAQAIQGARNVFVTKDTITIGVLWQSRYAVLIPFAIVLVCFVLGVFYFKKESKNFAENL
jgi:ABC-2 type transport system permease protein